MKKNSASLKTILVLSIAFIIAGGCKNSEVKADLEKEKAKIENLLQLTDTFLLTGDVKLIREISSCGQSRPYPFTCNVTGGEIEKDSSDISKLTDEEILEQYNLHKVKYTKLERPVSITRISPDGRMAYNIGKLKLEIEYTDSTGKVQHQDLEDSYIVTFVKQDTCWTEVDIAQTFKRYPNK